MINDNGNKSDEKAHKFKKIWLAIVIVIIPFILYFVGSFFMKRTDVYLEEYTVSDDQTEIQMNVFVASSMGYIGRYSVKNKDEGLYVTFYSTIGGLNSSLGAGNQLRLNIPEGCKAIYFNRSGNTYEKKLERNSESGMWERVK